jgi:hypothetical protein
MPDDQTKNVIKGAIEAIYAPIESIVKTLAGPAAEEIGLSLRDSVQAWRLKRQIRLFERVKKICEDAGIKPQAVKMPLLFEIMEKGSLEESDELQDIWANMLSNAADPKRASLVTTAYPEILKQLCIEEVKFLEGIFNTREAFKYSDDPAKVVDVRKTKSDYEIEEPLGKKGNIASKLRPKIHAIGRGLGEGMAFKTLGATPKLRNSQTQEIRTIYFDNMTRLGLISTDKPLDGSNQNILFGESDYRIGTVRLLEVGTCFLTALGYGFAEACAAPEALKTASTDQPKGNKKPIVN